MSEDVFVIVRRQPGQWQTATYRLSSFCDPHWGMTSGGVQARMNQPYIFGYVSCQDAVEGEVAHSGEYGIENHGPCPHRIKVCALKKDNKDVYKTLLEIVGPKPSKVEAMFL